MAEGFLHIIFDTFLWWLFLFILLCCDVVFGTGGYCQWLFKTGSQGNLKQTLDYSIYFIAQNKPFTPKRLLKCYILGLFVYMRSNTFIFKETNPFYSHCLISEPGFSLYREAPWWLVLVLNFWTQHPHRYQVHFNGGFQFACWSQ